MKKAFLIMAVLLFAAPLMADDYSITLGWTAPGDDTTSTGEWIGTCAYYDLRYSVNNQDILINDFWNAPRILDIPAPLEVGSPQVHSFQLDIQTSDTLYFAIRTADEVDNWSDISNVAMKTFSDDINPETVTDLTITVTVRVQVE